MNDAQGSAAETLYRRARTDGEDRARSERGHPATPNVLERVQFADPASRARLGGAGTIVLRMERLGPAARGRLAEVVDEAMERELAARGATSPGMGSSTDPDTAWSDQLFRARQVGVYRVIVALGPLASLCSSAGALQIDDAATLLFLARATTERPIELVLDTSDEHTGVFLTPVPLKDALSGRRRENVTSVVVPKAEEAKAEEPEVEEPKFEAPTVEVTKVELPSVEAARVEEPKVRPPKEPASPALHAAMEKHTVGVPSSFEDGAFRHWTLALHAAKGPQPLANFEKLFRECYVPLCDAVDHGLTDARAVHARDEFRASFMRMYTEACPAFAATGKRPKMVFDAPEIAARLGRTHHARTVQLLLVSSLRYDIGTRVRERLQDSAHPVVDEVMLWSALPTTTSRQLDCLSRGVEALRGPPGSERELEAVRGRMVDTVRRVKIGSREVSKLDACEARIREAGTGAPEALPDIAEAVARALAKHAATLAPRTLLFAFGDHGFAFDGSGVAHTGGATPEEVLVPAMAFFVRDEGA